MFKEGIKKITSLPPRNILVIAVTLAFIILVGIFGYFHWVENSCGFADEINAYTHTGHSVFFWGQTACPQISQVKKISSKTIDQLPKNGQFQILAEKQSRELEDDLSQKYLTYQKLEIGPAGRSFFAYEVSCGVCTRK